MQPKILLVNPNLMKPVVTPVALDYLGSALKTAGFEVHLLDLAFSKALEQDIQTTLSQDSFVLIGVTIRNIDDSYYASQDFILEKTKGIIDLIKKHTKVPLVLGGVGFSIMPEAALEYCGVDFGIVEEGELALPLLADRLVKQQVYSEIPNLVYRLKNDSGRARKDEYRRNRVQELDLAKYSFANRDIVDNQRYFREGGMVGFETKRGCNQPCSYCADPVCKGRVIRTRSPEDIVAELKGLYEKGIDCFHTCDSEFNVPEEHAIAVCEALNTSGLADKIKWYTYCSIDSFSETLARLMKKSGCVGIDFVADHVNPKMLKVLGKNYAFAEIAAAARLCHKYGFAFMFDLLLGAPGETRETVRETIEKMKQLNPTRVGISLGVRMYPKTRLYTQLKHELNKSEKELLPPTFYLAPELGNDIEEYIEQLTTGDTRFMFGNRKKIDRNYNYNDNNQLVQAIAQQGYRGAFWDILRKIAENTKPG